MFPVPPLAIGSAPLNVMLGVAPPEDANGTIKQVDRESLYFCAQCVRFLKAL